MRKKFYTRNVGVMLTEQCYQRLVNITDKMEVTVSGYIRELIEQRLKNDQREER